MWWAVLLGCEVLCTAVSVCTGLSREAITSFHVLRIDNIDGFIESLLTILSFPFALLNPILLSFPLSLSLPPLLFLRPRPDVGQCEVMYGYTAQQDDELTISPGDKVNIIEKYDEDWWQGELNGQIGIFPASYVQDL